MGHASTIVSKRILPNMNSPRFTPVFSFKVIVLVNIILKFRYLYFVSYFLGQSRLALSVLFNLSKNKSLIGCTDFLYHFSTLYFIDLSFNIYLFIPSVCFGFSLFFFSWILRFKLKLFIFFSSLIWTLQRLNFPLNTALAASLIFFFFLCCGIIFIQLKIFTIIFAIFFFYHGLLEVSCLIFTLWGFP